MTHRRRALVGQRLEALGYPAGSPPTVHGSYRPAVVMGAAIFTSGQIPVVDSVAQSIGKVGAQVSADEGFKAAELCAAAAIRAALSVVGDDDHLAPVKLTVFIAVAPGFTALPAVADGASKLMSAVFDEVPARSAVGVAELPLGVPVEVEAVFAVDRIV